MNPWVRVLLAAVGGVVVTLVAARWLGLFGPVLGVGFAVVAAGNRWRHRLVAAVAVPALCVVVLFMLFSVACAEGCFN